MSKHGNNKKKSGFREKVHEVIKVVRAPPPKELSAGGKIGAWMGDAAQSLLTRITGIGDYKVRSNTLVNGPPLFVGGHSTRGSEFCKYDFIGDVVGSVGFNNTAYYINPANSSIFPWLATQASGFEEWRLKGMVVFYKPTSYDTLSATSPAAGYVAISIQYNANDPVYSSRFEMENAEFAVDTVPSKPMLAPVECRKDEIVSPVLKVTQAVSLGAVQDLNQQHFGILNIATGGQQTAVAGTVLGSLYVSYHVELLKPRLPSVPTITGGLLQQSTTGIATTATNINSLGTAFGLTNTLIPFCPQTFSWNVASPAANSTNSGGFRLSTTGTLSATMGDNLTIVCGANPNGVYFPFKIFNNHIMQITMTYIGTVFTTVPVLTFNAGCAAENTMLTPAGATNGAATLSQLTQCVRVVRGLNGGNVSDDGAFLYVVASASTTTTLVNIEITIVR